MLPAAGLFNRLAPPHAGSSVEIKEDIRTRAATVLQHKMPIEQNGLHLGKEAIVAVQVCPAGLHHAHIWLGKVMDDLHKPVARRHKVRIKNGNEFTFRCFQAMVECPGLKTMPVLAVDKKHWVSSLPVLLNQIARHLFSFVGRVIEYLDFQQIARVIEVAAGLNETVNHE